MHAGDNIRFIPNAVYNFKQSKTQKLVITIRILTLKIKIMAD